MYSGGRKMIGHRSIMYFPVMLLMLVLILGCQVQGTNPPGISIVLAGSPLTSSSVSLSWEDNAANETGFRIERSLSGISGFQVIAEVGVDATSYVDSDLTPETPYYYKVSAFNDGGVLAYSNLLRVTTLSTDEDDEEEPEEAPAAPTDLSAEVLSSSSVRLTWTDNSDNEDGFDIFRNIGDVDPANLELLEQVPADTTEFTDTELSPASSVLYIISAYNDVDISPESNLVQVVTLSESSLSAPSNVSATQGTIEDGIMVSWDELEGATGYAIYFSDASDGIYMLLDETTDTSFGIADDSGDHFFFTVTAFDGEGYETDRSSPPAEGWAPTSGTVLIEAPDSVTASQGSSSWKIDVTWDAVDDAVQYNIYRSDSQFGTYSYIGSVSSGSTSTYNSTSSPSSYPITPGTHYFYKITSTDALSNESDMSSAAEGWAVVLEAPATVSATEGSYSWKIDIGWSTVDEAVQYNIYRATSEYGTYSYIGSVSSDYTSTYNSTSSPSSYPITQGTHYFFKISSSDAGSNESGLSAAVEGWAVVLQPPSGVSASDGTYDDKIRVSWQSNSYAAYYGVYYSTSSTGTYTFIEPLVSGTYMDITGATPGGTYYFKVCSVDADANVSSLSSYNSGWQAIIAPSDLSASPYSSGTIRLTWTDNSSGESGFRIYRSTESTGTYSLIATVSSNVTAYNNSGLTNYSHYYYRVRAYYGSNTSADSNTDDAYVVNPPALYGDAPYVGRIDLEWYFTWAGGVGSSNDRYSLEYRLGSTGTWSVYNSYYSNSSPYSVTLYPSVAPLYFRVRVYQGMRGGWSPYSNIVGPFN